MENKSSKQEDDRFLELELRQAAGEITRLKRQIRFCIKIKDVEAFEYTADFGYFEDSQGIVEEFKGFLYARHDFRLRMKICSIFYPQLIFKIVTKKGGYIAGYQNGKAIRVPRQKRLDKVK